MPKSSPIAPSQNKSTAQSYVALIKRSASSWMEDNCPRLSAALAFYTFLSIAPLLIITTKVSFLFFDPEAATKGMNQQISGLVGKAGASAVKDMIQNAGKPGAGNLATLVSLIVLLFSATGVFIELQDSMDIIWEVRPKPHQGIWGFVRNRLLSLAMVMGIAFILLVSLFVSTALSALTDHLGGGKTAISFFVELLTSTAVITVLFALIFKILPDAKIEWRNVWVGAVTSATLFDIGKYGLTLYFKFASTDSTYGAAGSLAALLIWVYYSAQLVFFGAEFTQVYAAATGHRILPDSNAVSRTEQERIAAGIPHEAVLNATAAADSRGNVSHVATPAVNFPEHDPSPLRTGTIGGCIGLVAGAAIAYFGRERIDRATLQIRARGAEKAAARELTRRIDHLEALPRLAQSIRTGDINRRINALSRQLTKTVRRTVPPAGSKV